MFEIYTFDNTQISHDLANDVTQKVHHVDPAYQSTKYKTLTLFPEMTSMGFTWHIGLNQVCGIFQASLYDRRSRLSYVYHRRPNTR